MISTLTEILPFVERRISERRLFDHRRVDAVLDTLAFVQATYSRLEIAAAALEEGALYRRLRDAQDVLKYALYAIWRNCPDSSSRRSTKAFGPQLYELYRNYLFLHDCVRAVEAGLMDYRIDS